MLAGLLLLKILSTPPCCWAKAGPIPAITATTAQPPASRRDPRRIGAPPDLDGFAPVICKMRAGPRRNGSGGGRSEAAPGPTPLQLVLWRAASGRARHPPSDSHYKCY